ncbi:MAG: DUF222 domain-containing protein [Jiangellaceae bacterium]
MFDVVVRVGDQVAGLVDALDPDRVAGRDAADLWGAFDRIERLGAAAKTLLARRVAEVHHPDRAGVQTAAEDLARRGGTTTGAARDVLDTSTRLANLQGVEAAVRRGELSVAQAAVVSGAAAVDPGAEQRLLALASRASLPELREECARVRAAADPDPDATNRRLHAARRLRRFTDPEGAWTLIAKGTPQAGAALNTALDPIIDEIFRAARRAGRQEPYEAYAFDALLALADRAGAQPGAGSSADGATDGLSTHTDSGERPFVTVQGKRPNARYLALLRVDVEALRRGAVAGEQLCEVTGVGPVPVSVARRLLGDAVLKLVITRGVDVCNVTHLGRGPTAAQRVALAWTRPGCTVEGCVRTRVEFDHRMDWKDTRHTRLDELDPLCAYHHDLKTRLGWALVPGHGKRLFVPPDDPRHPRHQRSAADRAPPGHGAAMPPAANRPSRRDAPHQQALLALAGDPPRPP